MGLCEQRSYEKVRSIYGVFELAKWPPSHTEYRRAVGTHEQDLRSLKKIRAVFLAHFAENLKWENELPANLVPSPISPTQVF